MWRFKNAVVLMVVTCTCPECADMCPAGPAVPAGQLTRVLTRAVAHKLDTRAWPELWRCHSHVPLACGVEERDLGSRGDVNKGGDCVQRTGGVSGLSDGASEVSEAGVLVCQCPQWPRVHNTARYTSYRYDCVDILTSHPITPAPVPHSLTPALRPFTAPPFPLSHLLSHSLAMLSVSQKVLGSQQWLAFCIQHIAMPQSASHYSHFLGMKHQAP